MTLKLLTAIETGIKQEEAEATLIRSCGDEEFTLLPWGPNCLLHAKIDLQLFHKLEDQLQPRSIIHGYTLKLELGSETALARLEAIVGKLVVVKQ